MGDRTKEAAQYTHMKPMPERMSGMPMCQFLSLKRLLLQAMYVLHRRDASDMQLAMLCMCESHIKPGEWDKSRRRCKGAHTSAIVRKDRG